MLSFTSPRTGLAVTPAALPDRIVVRLRPVADQAERTGRGQGGDGSGGVACIAGDVNPRGRSAARGGAGEAARGGGGAGRGGGGAAPRGKRRHPRLVWCRCGKATSRSR